MGEPGERDVGAVGDDDVHVTIQIDDDVDPAHQDAIRASVATLVNRSAQASRRARLLDQAHADLSAAHARPLIDAQPQVNEAVTAAAAAAKRVLEEDGSASFSTDPEWLPLPTRSLAIESPGVADQIFALPFPAQWEWHDGPRPPERSLADKTTGRLQLRGLLPNAGEWTEAHAGFGVTLTTPRLRAVIGKALRRTQHRYSVYARTPGVSVVEGGTELTVLENRNLIGVRDLSGQAVPQAREQRRGGL
jgi:hypothetical protein